MNSKNMLIDAFANWLFTLVALPVTLIFLIQNFGKEFVFNDFVKLILEFVFIGMLPLIIVFIRKENWENYGLTLINWKKSIAYGLILVVPFAMIKECSANLECKIKRKIPLGSSTLFLAEVVCFHVDKTILDERGGVNLAKAKPIMFNLTQTYWGIGEKLADYGFTKIQKLL